MDVLISLLVFVLIAVIVLWLAGLAVGYLPIPTTAQRIILAIIALILLLLFLQRMGWAF